VDINFVIFYRSENIIVPDGVVNGSLDSRICFLAGAETFPMIGLLLCFFTPGKFNRIYSG
jgi:hypothetical protein